VLAGLVGVLLFPYLFKPLMRLVTAALGAVLLAWAAGLADDLLVMGALTLVGFLVQMTDALLAKRRGGQKKKEKARDAEETG
jgi:hypothetical protein